MRRLIPPLASLGLAVFCLASAADDWPQWRGPNRDNKVTGFTAPADLAQGARPRSGRSTVGTGDASPRPGRATRSTSSRRQGGDEVDPCLDAANGKECGRTSTRRRPSPARPSGSAR